MLSGVSLALILLIAAGIAWESPERPVDTELVNSLSREVIKTRYYYDARILVQEYLGAVGELSELTVNSPYLGLTAEAKNSALELLVPAEAKGFHLDLVIALNYMEKGFAGDQANLDEGIKRMQVLIDENPWLNE